MSTINIQHLKKYIEQQYEESVIPSLIEYIKIDNLSRTYDSQWNTNGKLLKAANHIKEWVDNLNITGLTSQIIHDEGYSPLLYTEVKGDLPQTLFFYGHYDKQPPFKGWNQELGLGPTKPKIIDGKLYGRGGADDGYSTYSTMLGLKALQLQGHPIPRCVMLTQGDEQSGSGHMPHYLEKLKDRIGEPFAFFCLDSGCIDYKRMWLTTSLRGNLVATLKVKTNETALHSGTYSGVTPSCFRVTRILLNRLQNIETGEINKRFHCDIPPNRYKQNEELADLVKQQIFQHFPFNKQTTPLSKDPFVCLLKRNWHPSFTLTGQTGFPTTSMASNVLQPQIQVRFSVRLPPNFPPEKAEETLKQILEKDIPYGAQVSVYNIRASGGWNSNPYEPYFQKATREASQIFFENKLLSMGEGGTIPLMGLLQKMWPGRQFLITGVLGPNSNAHGPNQFLHIDYVKRLTCCLAYVVAKSSAELSSK